MFKNSYGEYDAELVRISMHLASGLVGNYGYTPDDADELLQTFILAGEQALPRFDPLRSKRSTFLFNVLHGKVIDLARRSSRGKRDKSREAFSFDEICSEDDGEENTWGDLIGLESTLNTNGAVNTNNTDWLPLRMDLEEILAGLPPELRKLCLLHSQLRPEEARKAAGMAKSTHQRAIQKIRQFLLSHGLGPSGPDCGHATDNEGGKQ